LLEVAFELPDLLVRHLLGELLELRAHVARLGELVVALLDREQRRERFLQIAEHVELFVERRLLRQVPDREPRDRPRRAFELLVAPPRMRSSVDFPRTVRADDADLRAFEERERDALQDLLLAEVLLQVLELEDDLVGHGGRIG
jgi:hypothetical protein